MHDSEEECEYDESYVFQLVRFVTRGRQPLQKAVDIVPVKWISFDQKSGKCMTKFLPPPYEDEDCELLHTLVENLADPPETWPTYPIRFKGRASEYMILNI